MNKNTFKTVKLNKGEVNIYDFGEVKLHAYKTNDLIDDEVFVLEKNGKGVVIELPCFFDNISELTDYLKAEGIDVAAKMVAYHCAGASFLPDVPAYSTKSAIEYNTRGGGAALVNKFTGAFGDIFDSAVCEASNMIEDGATDIAGIKLIITSTPEAFDIEIPEINCVYTHMLGHDCHSIVAGVPHADDMIAKLCGYIGRGVDLVLTSHYTPEDLKDAQTKIDYLNEIKSCAATCENAAEMKEKVNAKFPNTAE